MPRELPQFIQDMLAAPPRAGEGVHVFIFRVARQLHAHLPAGEIVALLEARLVNCGRHVPRMEIVSAVQSSLACAWRPGQKSSGFQPSLKWPPLNPERRANIIRDGGGLSDLWEMSPIRLESSHAQTEMIVDRLFPCNPLLCCGKSSKEFDTCLRNDWRGQLSQLQMIVPSPMRAPTGLTQDGRESAHALDNTGPRRFLVVEFDNGTIDEHAAVLIHLARYAPMVLAVYSGGKSLHGWFNCEGQPEETVLKFFRYAVSLGADSRLWTRSQFCRMPDGTRDNGNRQTVFYLNYRPLGATQKESSP